MSDRIPLVQGDTRPQVRALLAVQRPGTYDPTDLMPVDVSGGTPRLKFRAPGGPVLFTLTGTVQDGPAGAVVFVFAQGNLDLPPGPYESEISVTFADGARQTVYELQKYTLRADFE